MNFNMNIAFLFPGQGAQFIGMGKDLYEKYEEIQEVYNKVSDILGVDIKAISFDGPEDVLNQTKNTQVAILAMSLGILEVLKKHGINSNISAGLSLGEYSALIYSGYVSFEEGIKIVRKRGELMQENIPAGDWKMAGIIGLDDDEIQNICKNVKSGFVVPANYNCPGQVVISGEKVAVEEAMEKAKESGAKKAILLKTTGPFHTEKLSVAANKLKDELERIEIKVNPDKRVIRNIDAECYYVDDDIKEILAKHVMSPVKFKKSIEKMIGLRNRYICRDRARKDFDRFCKKSE